MKPDSQCVSVKLTHVGLLHTDSDKKHICHKTLVFVFGCSLTEGKNANVVTADLVICNLMTNTMLFTLTTRQEFIYTPL